MNIFNSELDVVEGNLSGTDAAGRVALANYAGVFVDGTSTGDTIGGFAGNERNVIAGNYAVQVDLYGSDGNNAVWGNWIGLNMVTIAGFADAGHFHQRRAGHHPQP